MRMEGDSPPGPAAGGKGRPDGQSSEHGGTRTPDPQNRNLMLYPTELHAQAQGRI